MIRFTNVHARGHNACILGEDQPFNPLLSNTGERVNSFPLDIKALKAMQGNKSHFFSFLDSTMMDDG